MTAPFRLDAPSELVPGADRLRVFAAAVEASGAVLHRVDARGLPGCVVSILNVHEARSISLADDLAEHRQSISEACRGEPLVVEAYVDVAADRQRLAALDACVTGCAAAVAATGSTVTTSGAGRGSALVAPLHVCVVRADQVVDGLADLFRVLRGLAPGSMVALQTGPSRSADIEKVLVIGAHGPRVVEIVLVEK
jgi:L-lactate dehydrogenase complex protein LldG